MSVSFQKLFFAIATVIAIFAILILAETILVPLGFALLISFILYPLAKKLEIWGINKMFAAFLSMLLMILIIGGGIFFFLTQITNLPNELSDFQDKIMGLLKDIIVYINNNFDLEADLEQDYIIDQLKEWFKDVAFPFAENTFYTTTSFLAGLLATIVYTFLFLIYRTGLTQAFCKFSPIDKREVALNMFKKVQKVGQKYLSGMIILIIILGTANSIGLWIIGVDSPFLFGFLAAGMSIIPYVGTTLGASIPVLYAFMSHDSLWIPFAVAVLFWAIQLIESNFLSPKVMGSSLQINALAAISLLIGASVWGIAGMILFLPFAAMLKVICEEYESLKPIALLIGSQEDEDKEKKKKSIQNHFVKIKSKLLKSNNKPKKITE
ncbi:MAG: AI-2E family transporter [Gelidibacter sp.]|nr:AI-2E family transporter [Gelidibacter sp.]